MRTVYHTNIEKEEQGITENFSRFLFAKKTISYERVIIVRKSNKKFCIQGGIPYKSNEVKIFFMQ